MTKTVTAAPLSAKHKKALTKQYKSIEKVQTSLTDQLSNMREQFGMDQNGEFSDAETPAPTETAVADKPKKGKKSEAVDEAE